MQKDEEVEFYREKFAGSQADRLVKAEAEAKKITDKLSEAKISGYFSLLSLLYVCMLTLFFSLYFCPRSNFLVAIWKAC